MTDNTNETGSERVVGSDLTAIAEYSETAAALADLRQRHAGVIYDVAKSKEMKAAKEARAELRTLRTSLEKKRVEIKAPALERCRLIDSEAKRITGELVALEEPIDVQIKAEESRVEQARLEKLEAERLRVEAINKRIDEIRNTPATMVGKPAVIIQGALARLKADDLSEDEFQEHFVTARDAHTTAIARIDELLQVQLAADEEKRRQAARDAEMEAMRQKMAEQQRKLDEAEAERVERERKAAAIEAGRIAQEAAEKRQREIDAQRAIDDAARAEREAQERAEREVREEQERLAREEAERVRAAEEARLQAERERLAAQQELLAKEAAALAREKAAAAAKAERDRLSSLGLRGAAQAVIAFVKKNCYADQVFDDLAAALKNDDAQAKPARAKRSAAA